MILLQVGSTWPPGDLQYQMSEHSDVTFENKSPPNIDNVCNNVVDFIFM